jgi:cytochrome c oxidase assembly protein subunit 11
MRMVNMTDNTKTAVRLLGTAVFMFAFGFLLVPLYDVLCAVTGFNGKTAGQYVSEKAPEIDKDRWVTVQFITNNNAGMPAEFRPKQRSMRVHPGEVNTAEFFVRNPVARTITAQAVPSVSPFHAASYLHKTECFCFEQQQLAEGEALDMPLRFIVDNELPADVTTLTLSYTLFNVSQEALAVAR